jgi:hypothetical protein
MPQFQIQMTPPGTSPYVTASGTVDYPIFTFFIPSGTPGPTGPPGPPGPVFDSKEHARAVRDELMRLTLEGEL